MNFLIEPPLPITDENLMLPGVIVTTGHPPHYTDDLDVRTNGILFCWVRKETVYLHRNADTRWTVNFGTPTIERFPFGTKEEALRYAITLARLHSADLQTS